MLNNILTKFSWEACQEWRQKNRNKRKWIFERWAEAEFERAAEKIRGFSWQGDW